jgi:elongation factor 1-alpha
MTEAPADKEHLSVVICGHVDSGKSTTTGHLLYQLGGISDRDLAALKKLAEEKGKPSFCFAFFMDTQKDEQERGITISCTTKEFFTPRYHYTIIDAPGHRDFMRNMISGASQADVGVLMVPADGGFGVAVQKGDHSAGEIQGQTRQHARLLNLLGIKQLIVCVNKMDSDTAGPYSKERFDEVKAEMASMLVRVGWSKKFVAESVPMIPISGWKGDNLFQLSPNMPWWSGQRVLRVDGSEAHVTTLHDALDVYAVPPPRNEGAVMRMPVSGYYKIKGVGDVITGRVEQGTVEPGMEVAFLPKHSASTPCVGKVFSIEMHHQQVPMARPGDNVGLNVKGLDKQHLPRAGDIMVLRKDTTLLPAQSFTAQVQVLDHPGELKVGYCPTGCVRTSHAPLRLAAIKWKMSKETGNVKAEGPECLKANDMAEVIFEPQQPFVVERFDRCEGLGRLAIMDGNTVYMLGKITDVTY